jgi:muramoyltetrapeptide carboxypeptidase
VRVRAVAPAPAAAGSHIRVVSPGFPTLGHLPERGRRGADALRGLGFDVSWSRHAYAMSTDGQTAGTERQRADDITEAFADPEVGAILVSDAGHGSRALIPMLDDAVIAANPKPFIGFCDTAYLQHHFALELGLGSYYGCSLTVHLGDVGGPFPETAAGLVAALRADGPLEYRPIPAKARPLTTWFDPAEESRIRVRDVAGAWEWQRGGEAYGPLVGGEISQLPGIVRHFGLSLDGSVVFVDITEEHTVPPQWLLARLFASVDLRGVAGLLIAANPIVAPALWSAQVRAAVDRLLPGTTFPVVVNVDICHMAPCWTVPFGEPVHLTADRRLVFPREAP